MSGTGRKMADDSINRRRAYVGQDDTDLLLDPMEGVQDHPRTIYPRLREILVARSQHLSIGAPGMANQKTKMNIKLEPLPPSQDRRSETMKEAGMLTSRAQQLIEDQRVHSETVRKLEQQIEQSEVILGKMLQDLTQLQRAVELKKKHIKEDREARERELSSSHLKTESVRLLLAKANAILSGENNTAPAGASQGPSRQP